MYLVLSVFTSSPISLVATTRASALSIATNNYAVTVIENYGVYGIVTVWAGQSRV
jgi:hypothetical protein